MITYVMRALCVAGLCVVLLVLAGYAYLAVEAAGRRRAHRARPRLVPVPRPREDRYERLVRRASSERLAAWR